MAFVILIIILLALVAGLVLFNVLPLKKNKENASGVENKKKENNINKEKPKKSKTTEPDIKDLFNKKDEKKKKKTTCASCGCEVEVYDGSGRCPYCGAKFVKK